MTAILFCLYAFCASLDGRATLDFSDEAGRGILRIHVSLFVFDDAKPVVISYDGKTEKEVWKHSPDGQFLARPGDSYPVYRSDSPVVVTVGGIRHTFAAGALRAGRQD